MIVKHGAIALACIVVQTALAAPRTAEYAQGIRLDADASRPLAQLQLPDDVYRYVTRTDLADLRVFNADGVAVPHAFCISATAQAPTVSRNDLPVFDLQAPAKAGEAGTHLELETAAGSRLRVQEGDATPAADGTRTWAHVVDARAVAAPLHSIEFDWTSPDGASQAGVRIEASDDLDRWRTVVASSTLLRVVENGRELQRKAIELPPAHYDYLRVVRTDGGPSLKLAAVIGVSQSSSDIEPQWFTADRMNDATANELWFDAGRVAPIAYARVRLPQDNSSMRLRIESRSDPQAPWRERWRGEVYSILKDGQRRSSAPAQIAIDYDRYWRLSAIRAADPVDPALALELGYRPALLRFLVQGPAPFTLAFGSRRADPAPQADCGSLLSGIPASDLDQLTGDVSAGAAETLGGETALKPLPQRTPVRLVVLWGVLIVGAAVVVAMAVSLLKRLNPPPP